MWGPQGCGDRRQRADGVVAHRLGDLVVAEPGQLEQAGQAAQRLRLQVAAGKQPVQVLQRRLVPQPAGAARCQRPLHAGVSGQDRPPRVGLGAQVLGAVLQHAGEAVGGTPGGRGGSAATPAGGPGGQQTGGTGRQHAHPGGWPQPGHLGGSARRRRRDGDRRGRARRGSRSRCGCRRTRRSRCATGGKQPDRTQHHADQQRNRQQHQRLFLPRHRRRLVHPVRLLRVAPKAGRTQRHHQQAQPGQHGQHQRHRHGFRRNPDRWRRRRRLPGAAEHGTAADRGVGQQHGQHGQDGGSGRKQEGSGGLARGRLLALSTW
jgi:hypothetical protein